MPEPSPDLSPADVTVATATLPPAPTAGPAAPPPVDIPGYEIIAELGRGGMGVVYKARQVGANRVVALKMVLAGDQAGPDERARFEAEVKAVGRLQHPGIVQVYEVGERDGRPFFSLEYCPGGSLAARLAGTPLPAAEAARLVEALASAVAAAHAAGVVHRDLKPANVLLAAGGSPKITDFGLAKRSEDSGQTRSGTVVGTPSYMAPEQARGQVRAVGPPADVYALGAVLYECLTGRPPFRGATVLDTLEQVCGQEPATPRSLNPAVPRDLETVCLKCLQKDPAKRYASAGALADDLRRFLEGRPVTARRVGPVGRVWRWARRNPVVAGLLAAVLLTTTAGAVVAWLLALEARSQKGEADRNAADAQDRATEARLRTEEARQEKERVRRLLYAANLNLAGQAWREHRASRACELLAELAPAPGEADLRGWEWYYLWRAAGGDRPGFHTRPGGPGLWGGEAYPFRLSADGAWAGAALLRPDAEAAGVEDQADVPRQPSAPGRMSVREATVWDAADGRVIFSRVIFSPRLGPSVAARYAIHSPSRSVAWEEGRKVTVYDADTAKERASFVADQGVWGLQFDPTGRRLAVTLSDGLRAACRLLVWDLGGGPAAFLPPTEGQVTIQDVAFSPDGSRLAVLRYAQPSGRRAFSDPIFPR
jgi:tRNA A-37 threonylcarbamoyl transferase component Bud32